MLFADSILQQSAGLITILIVALIAWLGSRYGLFLATVWGLQALASVVAAFAITDHVDGLLMWAGMTNEFAMIWRQTIAFVTSVVLVAIVIRLMVGGAIQEGATNYPPLVDLVGGGVVGALAGLVVAGTLQVILAMAPLPDSMAFDHTKLGWDLGQGIIDLVGHCAPSMSSEERGIMMDGEPGFRAEKEDPAKALPPPQAPVDPSQPVLEKIELPQWSEVYADINWNQQWDEGEKYLDADDNGAFTWCLRSNDLNTNKTRDIGLRERYALGPWVTVRTVTKMDVQRLQRNGKLGPVEGLPYPPPGGLGPGMTPPVACGWRARTADSGRRPRPAGFPTGAGHTRCVGASRCVAATRCVGARWSAGAPWCDRSARAASAARPTVPCRTRPRPGHAPRRPEAARPACGRRTSCRATATGRAAATRCACWSAARPDA